MATEEGEPVVVATLEHEKLTEKDVVIVDCDMPTEMQTEAIEVILNALDQSSIEKDAAIKIKQTFDSKYVGSTWHCIVGKRFAASLTYHTKFSIFVKIRSRSVMLFKSCE